MPIIQSEILYAPEDERWLASQHGVDAARTITLDVTLFAEGLYDGSLGGLFGAAERGLVGYIPSGVALGQVTGAGATFGPYDPGATDGRDRCVGLLRKRVQVVARGSDAAVTKAQASLLWHGVVDVTWLPVTSGAGALDADGKADLAAHVYFVAS